MAKLDCVPVDYGSEAYRACVHLRERLLRQPLGVEFTEQELALEPSSLHLAGFLGSKLVACLVLTPKGTEHVQMRQVAVETGFQRQGMGRALVAFAEAEARQRGFQEMFAHARAPAVPFYRQLGYAVEEQGFIEVGVLHHSVSKSLV